MAKPLACGSASLLPGFNTDTRYTPPTVMPILVDDLMGHT